jgi:hypothetical protein
MMFKPQGFMTLDNAKVYCERSNECAGFTVDVREVRAKHIKYICIYIITIIVIIIICRG